MKRHPRCKTESGRQARSTKMWLSCTANVQREDASVGSAPILAAVPGTTSVVDVKYLRTSEEILAYL
eukprot:6174992-Pleurochrysis_carterae.AAC.1